ncbi:MAG: hypothetical protein HEQ39_09740 [Rhizobacter sp.]
MSTSVKFLHSAMVGAPSLTGQVGSLIAVWDACLVNGFGLKTVDSLVVASNVATMNISTGHAFEVGSVVLVAGAAPAGLNGEQRITAVTTNTASFATSGISNQTATGSINARLAPAGWGKPFSGTNLSVYRSADVTGNRHFLRVNDNFTTDPRSARLVGYETMSDVDTGTGPFPTPTQASGGGWLTKSSMANATARPWMFFGDEKLFYFCCSYAAGNAWQTYFFGEPIPFKNPDPYNTLFGFAPLDVNTQGQFQGSLGNLTGTVVWDQFSTTSNIVARASTGLGTARAATRVTSGGLSSGVSGLVALCSYPNAADNALHFTEILSLSEASYRARFPGVYFVPQQLSGAFSARDVVLGSGPLVGKRFVQVPDSASGAGAIFFDQLGPWR